MNRSTLRNFVAEQVQKANPAIINLLLRWRARTEKIDSSHRPVLVFSPHKDDEVLGCGGTIILKRRMGVEVYIVFMTDGRASHQSHFITPEELVKLRTAEARNCARVMGVPEENLIFFEFEERCLGQHQTAARLRVAEILRDLRPAEVFVPYHREMQADHFETYKIVKDALGEIHGQGRPPVNLYEYFVWIWRLWFWQIEELRHRKQWCKIDVRPIRQIKQKALQQYKSQTTILYPDPRWRVLPEPIINLFSQPYEYFFKNF
ncbi:MAG: PIG-L family deacetylase [candidate division KSB1 bacterium]|nr:PIG-L family deacetylase [candidate division KSB1 bacterium]MDZ7301670.1 PIG-L family deacetylase [candidate division KSB1 bacterium]MDZ7314306.1 PIG-L family deacetylase [candidate division KSB1 bacterium]